MNALDILINARDLVVNGWRQHGFVRRDPFAGKTCYCAMGALNVAAGRPSTHCPESSRNGEPAERACFFLANAVTGDASPSATSGDVINFNDSSDCSQDQVVKAFDVAICNCRRRKTTKVALKTAR